MNSESFELYDNLKENNVYLGTEFGTKQFQENSCIIIVSRKNSFKFSRLTL